MKLTRSELHALMTSGFATVAGTVIAAYVEFGVSVLDKTKGILICFKVLLPFPVAAL